MVFFTNAILLILSIRATILKFDDNYHSMVLDNTRQHFFDDYPENDSGVEYTEEQIEQDIEYVTWFFEILMIALPLLVMVVYVIVWQLLLLFNL